MDIIDGEKNVITKCDACDITYNTRKGLDNCPLCAANKEIAQLQECIEAARCVFPNIDDMERILYSVKIYAKREQDDDESEG